MIETLHIENVGIIDNITIDFKEGLNVITGETGAGKSLLVDAISLICGNRFSKDIIKTGTDYCLVEVMLSLSNESDNIVVSREVSNSGKNKCKINGRLVTVNELKKYMSSIINIHGQNDNQNLFDEGSHIIYLDKFCKDSIVDIKNEYLKLYNEYLSLENQLKNNYGNEREKERMLDLLNYEISEIDDANFKIGEDVELEEKSKIIRNSKKIYEAIAVAEHILSSTIISDLDVALKNICKISEYNDLYKAENDRLQNMYYELQDVSNNLYSYKEEVCFDKRENDEVLTRLDLLYSLKRKYGNSIEEIIEYRNKIQVKKDEIQNMETYLINTRKKLDSVKKEMLELSQKLNYIRINNGKILEESINKELADLDMKNAKIKVDVKYEINGKFNKNGLNSVAFKILTNVGDEYKSFNKIASGGEISRIMLAIKKVLSEVDEVKILVFDELDTGISGKAGSVVGRKLKDISLNHQVMCITHLGVVAAYANYNYFISKKVSDNRTSLKIKLLDENETIREIARISSGVLTNFSIESARELRMCAINR